MRLLQRNLTIGACAAITAGISWALASGGGVLYPATLNIVVAMPSETVVSVQGNADPVTGNLISKTRTVPSGTAGPYTVDLTVDGGSPCNSTPCVDDDPGVVYRPGAMVYVSNPGTVYTYLSVVHNNPITINNTPAAPSASATATFSYPVTYRATAVVEVKGGTLSRLDVVATSSTASLNETYGGSNRTHFDVSRPSVASAWVPMVPNSKVSLRGTAYLVASDGTVSTRALAAKTINLSQGPVSATWQIDLANTGSLAGDIDLTSAPTSGSIATGYELHWGGLGGASGFKGTLEVLPESPSYTLDLTPGDYDLSLVANLTSPRGLFRGARQRVTIDAGATAPLRFTDGLAVAHVGLSVDGFYAKTDLSGSSVTLTGSRPDELAQTSELVGGAYPVTLPPGTWRPSSVLVGLANTRNPALWLYNKYTKFFDNEPSLPTKAIAAGGDFSLGTAKLTLVKTNVYFDVIEARGTPAVNITSPRLRATKREYNPDSSLRSHSLLDAKGSDVPQPVPGFTVVGEPGEYELDAAAIVNGTLTKFNGTTITFGEPIATDVGATGVTLTPIQNPDLRITLGFPSPGVARGGVSTVVESPLGPAPPEGLAAMCEQICDAAGHCDQMCPPIYYDISTTAMVTFPATVCVRRLVRNVNNGAVDFLHLYHYNESLPGTAAQKWEQLKPPVGRPAAIDCGSQIPGDLAACGCASEASCGIDLNAGLDVFLVCGETRSFSPFAIFQSIGATFTNVVDGVTYTGPTGPPSLQQWTAPQAGTYRITATGAQGASTSSPALAGGCGAQLAGDFALQPGDVVEILVGQKGTATASNAGGGGGTFVTLNRQPLVIAGGGGGVRATAVVNGRSGTVASTGTAGSTSIDYLGGFISGGESGTGGRSVPGFGTGGGGWIGDGAVDGANGEGGFAFLGVNRGQGGLGRRCGDPAHGGYGGGGAGNGCFGAGGGGGYSGGGGGRIAGGGGSLNRGANQAGREDACTRTGHGLVTIASLPN